MFAVIVAFVLLAFQPAPVTVADCLLRSGYSHSVEPSAIAALEGTPAPEWADVLTMGDAIGVQQAQTDTGRRVVVFYAYAGAVYVFVGKHRDDPGHGSGSVVHGDCLLRIGG